MCIIRHLIVLIITSFYLLGCDSLSPCTDSEKIRVSSKDNKAELILIEKNCGATTSLNSNVYIIPTGMDTNQFTPVFISDKVEGINIF